MRPIDADALRQVLEVFTEKDTLGHTPLQLCDAMPTAFQWHMVEEELPKDDCEVFTASRLPFDKTDTWIYEHSFFTTDVSECEELKDEYPNEHKAAFYKWSDISDKYVICHYGLKYWMPIEPPKEIMNE